MRVIQLRAENIKRLSAIDITPGDGSLITIAGRNDQGKSSVIDSIAMALGGVKLTPKQPIKGDSARGEVFIDLGDYKVTRVYTRARAACDCPNGEGATQHHATCASLTKWGKIDSTLTVRSPDGAKYPSPQTLLAKMVGELSFDPLAFLEMDADEQDATLRRLAGIDTRDIDLKREGFYTERTVINRDVKTLEATLSAAPHFPDAPAEEISVDALVAESDAAEVARRAAEDASRASREATAALERAAQNRTDIQDAIQETILQIEALQQTLVRLQQTDSEAVDVIHARRKDAADALATADALVSAVPDVGAINARIREANATNEKVRANILRGNIEKRVERRKADVAAQTAAIDELDTRKATMLAEAKFPIDGLGLSDDGPTFAGQLLAQASTAAKLRVSVAMGLALNPKLKVLLVHEGNDLDDDSLRLLGELAAEAGAQVWLERIAGNKDGVSILIEDGAVKSAGA